MSKDPRVEALYEHCNTLPELRQELAKILETDGMSSEKWLGTMVTALFGGTTVYYQDDGQYANKWRRKFYKPVFVNEEDRVAA
jgi:hypothetical protein